MRFVANAERRDDLIVVNKPVFASAMITTKKKASA